MSGTGSISAAELFLLLVAASTVVAILTRRMAFLPYSVGLVVLGLAISALNLPIELEIGPELLLTVLLPGLVFEAAYRTDVRVLWPSSAAVAFLAVPGVLITAAIVAAVVDAVTGVGFVLAFLVGTMLAATDPAAVIAVVSHLRAPPRLITLIEAESLFNDGTGIVIFALALTAVSVQVEPGGMLVGLLTTVAVSSLIGAAIGFVASRGVIRVEDHLVELMISVVAAYGSYLRALRLGQSGLIATVVCGLVFGSYGRRVGITERGAEAMDTVWEFGAYLLTTLVFLLIGLAISVPQLREAALPIVAALAALLVSRGVVVYLLLGGGSRLAARLGWAKPMPTGWLHVIAWSGLRGAVSVALALSLPADLPHRDLLQGIVFGCVLLTLVLHGSTADLLVRRLGLAQHTARE
ncbi:MAG TPA: sodium:proton antiporter [Candidatus Binatia bacterium]|nr:sodium:proton antiporter [Candidatus Binatia bacterium]